MLVEFKVKNFRSFRDETTLMMQASPDKSLLNNVRVTSSPGDVDLLLVSAIYGPNASGKSNLLRALSIFQYLVLYSASLPPSELLPFEPFRLNDDSISQPVEFEMTFLIGVDRYNYSFSFLAGRVISEHLKVYKAARPQKWFKRSTDASTGEETYVFGSYLQGQKNVWSNATRQNVLFLSQAVLLNSEQLRIVYEWIAKISIWFNNSQFYPTAATIDYIQEHGSQEVSLLMQSADTGIAAVELEKDTRDILEKYEDPKTGQIATRVIESEYQRPLFVHKSLSTSTKFELADESEGTKRLFLLAGPLFNVLNEGRVLFVDELEQSLHPNIVKELISLFNDQTLNKNGAQLVFTTHNTNILDSDFLRRDQYWFVEKGVDQASELFSLADYSPRKNEAFEKGYLSGRYGALPVLERFKIDAFKND